MYMAEYASLDECLNHLLEYVKYKFYECNMSSKPQKDHGELLKDITDPSILHIFSTFFEKKKGRNAKVSKSESSLQGPLPYVSVGKKGKPAQHICVDIPFPTLKKTGFARVSVGSSKSGERDVEVSSNKACFPDEVIYRETCYPLNHFAVSGINLRQCDLTLPLITIDSRPYQNLKVGDYIYIFQILRSDGGVAHLAALIVTTEGVIYSFGFGFPSGSSTARSKQEHLVEVLPGTLYTPDGPLERNLLDQINNPTLKFLNLVAASVFTEASLANLKKNLDMITTIQNVYMTWSGPFNLEGKQVQYKDLETGVTSYTPVNVALRNLMSSIGDAAWKDIEEGNVVTGKNGLHRQASIYHEEGHDALLSPEQILGKSALYKTYTNISTMVGISVRKSYYWNTPVKYCELSSYSSDAVRRTQTNNCARFIYNIFDDIIDCTFSTVAVAPGRCGQRRTVPKRCHSSVAASTIPARKLYGLDERTLLEDETR
jgi:hypothetical protein